MMLVTTPGTTGSRYATPEDFCVIFNEDMNRLYLMALLLTGDQVRAEQCFSAALEDCRQRHDIFAEWGRSWSRRAIVKQAMRLTSVATDQRTAETAPAAMGENDNVRHVLQLPVFERFVFVMSVLEKYSLHECAALLNCRVRDVETTRVRALHLAASHALIAAHLGADRNQTSMALKAS